MYNSSDSVSSDLKALYKSVIIIIIIIIPACDRQTEKRIDGQTLATA